MQICAWEDKMYSDIQGHTKPSKKTKAHSCWNNSQKSFCLNLGIICYEMRLFRLKGPKRGFYVLQIRKFQMEKIYTKKKIDMVFRKQYVAILAKYRLKQLCVSFRDLIWPFASFEFNIQNSKFLPFMKITKKRNLLSKRNSKFLSPSV